jgi:hypothetical protein
VVKLSVKHLIEHQASDEKNEERNNFFSTNKKQLLDARHVLVHEWWRNLVGVCNQIHGSMHYDFYQHMLELVHDS